MCRVFGAKMICDACFGNEYKKPKMIFLGWGSGTVCPECYEYIKKVKNGP